MNINGFEYITFVEISLIVAEKLLVSSLELKVLHWLVIKMVNLYFIKWKQIWMWECYCFIIVLWLPVSACVWKLCWEYPCDRSNHRERCEASPGQHSQHIWALTSREDPEWQQLLQRYIDEKIHKDSIECRLVAIAMLNVKCDSIIIGHENQ